MAKIKPESKMLEEVRRWRREAYEQRQKMTFEQQTEEDRRLAAELGLQILKPQDLVKPVKSTDRDAA